MGGAKSVDDFEKKQRDASGPEVEFIAIARNDLLSPP